MLSYDTMSAKPLDVFRRTLDIIQVRGWSVNWSNGPNSTVNLRSAIMQAVTDISGGDDWYRPYLASLKVINEYLHDGVMSWEFGTHANPPRKRIQSEVEQMLGRLIAQLEKNEVKYRRRTGSDSRTV